MACLFFTQGSLQRLGLRRREGQRRQGEEGIFILSLLHGKVADSVLEKLGESGSLTFDRSQLPTESERRQQLGVLMETVVQICASASPLANPV